jgi:hypothetical protein
MTGPELTAVVRAIAPVIREHVTKTISEVVARLAVAEARVAAVGDLRDRLVTLETKAAAPVVTDPRVGELRDRLLVLETKAATPIALDETIVAAISGLRERVAVLEVRGLIPGPAGQDGKDGTDGLGFEDLSVDFDGDRTLALKFERGTVKKTFPIVLPFLRYEGVFIDGKSYDVGDVVTWAGSTWNCQEPTTTKPGEGSSHWKLMVKRGRDGKDGRDAPAPLPVVAVGGSR